MIISDNILPVISRYFPDPDSITVHSSFVTEIFFKEGFGLTVTDNDNSYIVFSLLDPFNHNAVIDTKVLMYREISEKAIKDVLKDFLIKSIPNDM